MVNTALLLCKVLLVPGAFGASASGMFLDPKAYFADYEVFLRKRGCLVRKVEFPVDVTIELRARLLRDQAEKLVKEAGGGPITILAHSQGGLDARFALRTLGLKGVAALVTVGVPHHGTPLADWVLKHRSRGSFLYWVLRIFGNYDLRELPFVGEMTEGFLSRHEASFQAVPGVKYASARGACRQVCHWSLRLLDWISGEGGIGTPRAGDGLIPSDSQRFGEDLGEFDLDHISEVSSESVKTEERQRFLNALVPYIGTKSSPLPSS